MNNFLELNLENIPDYYRRILSKYLFKADLLKVDEVHNGFNNYLFRLIVNFKGKHKVYYLKQAQKYNKRSYLQGKPIYLSPTRIIGEVDLISRLEKIWPIGTVPKIIYFDKKNYIFLMNDISGNAKFLPKEFDRNKVHPEAGSTLGRLLAKLHSSTWKKSVYPKSKISYQNKLKKELFEKNWSKGIKKVVDSKLVNSLFKPNKYISTSLIWGDPIYRNIFVKPNGKVSLVDFDHTLKFNPLLDSGILLSHWTWMWLKPNKKLKKDCEKFIKNYISNYYKAWFKHPNFDRKIKDEFDYWLPCWIGWYMLSRTEGKSGSYFEKYPTWEKKIKQLGIDLIEGNLSEHSRKIVDLLK